jgi:hypothetical protein
VLLTAELDYLALDGLALDGLVNDPLDRPILR